MDDSAESIVEYGINGFALTASGESQKFVDGGSAQHSQYIHKVKSPIQAINYPIDSSGMSLIFCKRLR